VFTYAAALGQAHGLDVNGGEEVLQGGERMVRRV
jgi:hypothetical protein